MIDSKLLTDSIIEGLETVFNAINTFKRQLKLEIDKSKSDLAVQRKFEEASKDIEDILKALRKKKNSNVPKSK